MDQDVKTLIKSVASEIQKSFSQKNLEDVFYDAEEDLDDNNTNVQGCGIMCIVASQLNNYGMSVAYTRPKAKYTMQSF